MLHTWGRDARAGTRPVLQGLRCSILMRPIYRVCSRVRWLAGKLISMNWHQRFILALSGDTGIGITVGEEKGCLSGVAGAMIRLAFPPGPSLSNWRQHWRRIECPGVYRKVLLLRWFGRWFGILGGVKTRGLAGFSEDIQKISPSGQCLPRGCGYCPWSSWSFSPIYQELNG